MFFKLVPSLLLGSHIYTVCLFRSFVKFFALLHHSGYEFSVNNTPMHKIPLMSSPSNHDFHHYNGYNNYGTLFSFWDKFFGTYTTWEDKAKKMGTPQAVLDKLSESEVVAMTMKGRVEKGGTEFNNKVSSEMIMEKLKIQDRRR